MKNWLFELEWNIMEVDCGNRLVSTGTRVDWFLVVIYPAACRRHLPQYVNWGYVLMVFRIKYSVVEWHAIWAYYTRNVVKNQNFLMTQYFCCCPCIYLHVNSVWYFNRNLLMCKLSTKIDWIAGTLTYSSP